MTSHPPETIHTPLKWVAWDEDTWMAQSSMHDDGYRFKWRVVKVWNGFSVSSSDDGLTQIISPFKSVELAKDFCEKEERDMFDEI